MNKYSKESKLLVESLYHINLENDEGIEFWQKVYEYLEEKYDYEKIIK